MTWNKIENSNQLKNHSKQKKISIKKTKIKFDTKNKIIGHL